MDEYKRVPSIRHIVLIDPEAVRLVLWSRADDAAAWSDLEISNESAALALTAVNVSLPLAEIYEALTFT